MQVLSRARVRPALSMTLLLCLVFVPVVPVAAQAPVSSVSQSRGMISEEAQAELYGQLEAQSELLRRQSQIIKTVAKLIGPTVVHIEADVSNPRTLQHGQGGQIEEAGSGVIIKRKGRYYVLTNRHVIRGAVPEGIRIVLADRRLLHPIPTRLWEDAETDVAVMEIEGPHLVDARIGDSDTLEIGDFVLAVGSPFGLSHSVTFGIVSAKNRRALQLGGTGVKFQDFIQTDAAINPGNSGGPLINLRGEIVGINTAIASNSGGSEGIGFAIPIKMFMQIAGQLIDHGKVDRAFLGVTIERTFDAALAKRMGLPRPMGALIKGITKGSPAAEAKLLAGDVILAYEGISVADDNHLVNLISFSPIGKEVSMIVFRDRKEITLTAKLDAMQNFNLEP